MSENGNDVLFLLVFLKLEELISSFVISAVCGSGLLVAQFFIVTIHITQSCHSYFILRYMGFTTIFMIVCITKEATPTARRQAIKVQSEYVPASKAIIQSLAWGGGACPVRGLFLTHCACKDRAPALSHREPLIH